MPFVTPFHRPLRLRPLLLSWRHWTLSASTLAALLLLLDFAAPLNPIRVWYWMRLVAPAQELRYGFRAHLAADHQSLVIFSVAPGGPFAQAGVLPDFVALEPSCLGFGAAELFLRRLRDTPAGFLKLRFVTDGAADGHSELTVATVRVPSAGADR